MRIFFGGTLIFKARPAAVRVLDKNGWLQIKNTGTLPALTESSKLIWLKKGNNSDGLASIFPKLSAEETEELVPRPLRYAVIVSAELHSVPTNESRQNKLKSYIL